MLKINKQTITMTKGDDASLQLVPRYKDKSVYVVQEGDNAIFRLKVANTVRDIPCVLNTETNKIVVTFDPDDTKDFAPGIYRYEVELITNMGFHYTFIADQPFILGQELEQRLTSVGNTNGSISGNLPNIDGEIGEEPVIYGDIQPTNPMLDYNDLNHKPTLNGFTIRGDKTNEDYGIPTKLSEMLNDDNYVQDEDYQHTDNNYDDTAKGIVDGVTDALADKVDKIDGKGLSTNDYTDTDKAKLDGIQSGAEVNVQSDWNEADTSQDDYIKNKPTLGTASSKNATSSVTSGSTDLVESGAVKTAIDNAVASSYHHAGVKTVAELVPALLIAENQGNVYNITDDGVTTADFIEGAGLPIKAGDNVGVAQVGSGFKFDLLSGFIDTSNFVEKSATSGLIKNDGSIDTNTYAKTSEIPDISGKADKSEMSITTNGDKTTIQLKNGTSAQVINAHQDISGKAEKSEMSVTNGTGADADKVTIQLKSDTSATVLKTHQDISGKVDKDGDKVLSTNDYTDEDKDKLDGISDEANKVESSETNGNIKINGVETTVYDDTEIKNALSTDTTEVEGNPLNFTTLSAQTAESTIVDLEPIQDLHGYDKPWVGGANINLLPAGEAKTETNNGITFTSDGNGVYTVKGTAGNGGASCSFSCDAFNIPDGANHVMGFFNTQNLGNGSLFRFNKDSTTIETWSLNQVNRKSTYSGMSNKECNKFEIGIESNKVVDAIISPMIVEGSSVDAIPDTFSPYKNECPISGRTEIGILGDNGKETTDPDYEKSNDLLIEFGDTVFGAHHNLEKGILTVDRAIEEYDGSNDENWSKTANENRYSIPRRNVMKYQGWSISNLYEYFIGAGVQVPDQHYYIGEANVGVRNNLITTLEDWKTYLASNHWQVVYELATPITIQLTPNEISLLEGVNNISTDGDKITLTYRSGEVATLGDVLNAEKKLTNLVLESQIFTDTVTGDKYKLVVTNGVLSVEQISN